LAYDLATSDAFLVELLCLAVELFRCEAVASVFFATPSLSILKGSFSMIALEATREEFL
jgi:hypothetical protein